MRRVLIAVILLVSMASAQEIYGTWLDRTGGTVLVLAEDGNYTWQGSVGSFWIEEGSIMFRDALSGDIASFAIAYAGDVMQFTDHWMGARTVLVRKGSPAEGLPLEVILEDLESVSPELASKDGFILREEETRTAFEMLEFIIAAPLSEEESNEILDAWLEEFDREPAKLKSRMGELAGMRDHLYRIMDPWEVAGFYLRNLTDACDGARKDTQDVFCRAVMEHLGFLSFDKEEKVWLTDRSVDAYLDYACFLVGLAEGKSLRLSKDVKDSLSERLAGEFAGYAAKEREFISASPVLVRYFGCAWGEASDEERAAIAKDILGELLPPGVDFGKLLFTPGDDAQYMTSEALQALDKVLELDHVAPMKRLIEGRDWPYYYEISSP